MNFIKLIRAFRNPHFKLKLPLFKKNNARFRKWNYYNK